MWARSRPTEGVPKLAVSDDKGHVWMRISKTQSEFCNRAKTLRSDNSH